MQISASASPAAYPPGVSMPASITRAPPGSVRSVTRSASAFVAMRSAISNARPFRSSPPLSPPPLARSPPSRAPPTRPSSSVARHHDQPAPHPRPDVGPRLAADDDLAPRHPAGRPGPGAARVVPGVAVHVDPAARHLHAQVPAHATRHDDLAGRHPGTDPFHVGELALDPDRG